MDYLSIETCANFSEVLALLGQRDEMHDTAQESDSDGASVWSEDIPSEDTTESQPVGAAEPWKTAAENEACFRALEMFYNHSSEGRREDVLELPIVSRKEEGRRIRSTLTAAVRRALTKYQLFNKAR